MLPTFILAVVATLHSAPQAKHPPRERVTITIEPLPAPASRYVLPIDRNGTVPLSRT